MVTSSRGAAAALRALMERGREYSIPELVDLAESVIELDEEDLVYRMYDGVPEDRTFNRQVKNALAIFRDEDGPVQWNGGLRRNSRYFIMFDDEIAGLIDFGPLEDDPPPAQQEVGNDGYLAEQFVAEYFREQEWDVVNVRNRGFGFDLVAYRAQELLRIEVKSSGGITDPELTESEMNTARNYAESFVLVIVDNWDGEQGEITRHDDVVNSMQPIEEITRVFHRLTRN